MGCIFFMVRNVGSVTRKTEIKRVACFTNILMFTVGTGDEINQIRTNASHGIGNLFKNTSLIVVKSFTNKKQRASFATPTKAFRCVSLFTSI